MTFKFASWNVNNRNLKSGHVDFLNSVRPDLIALQEVSSNFHHALDETRLFDWSAFSLALRPPASSDGLSRRLGCSLFGRTPFRLESFSLLEHLSFPERSLAAQIRTITSPLTVCSFHIPPGSSWGNVKPDTMKAISQWLATLEGDVLFGMDANAPKTDHPDISKNDWWWEDEPLLLGAVPTHHLKDALRSYLQAHPADFSAIMNTRPDGPLAVSHIRGKKRKRTLCRYDFIYCTPSLAVENISYLYEQSLVAGSDHSLVIAELRLPMRGAD